MRQTISKIIYMLAVAAAVNAVAQDAQAPVPTKTVELEWEAEPQAENYEVRLTPATGEPPLVFTATENKLTQDIPVGLYNLEVRVKVRDEDNYSPWSDPVEIEVVSKNTVPLKPENESLQTALSTKDVPIEFQWAPVDRVREYTVRVWNEARRDNPWVFTTRKTSKVLNVPPGEVYSWQVFFDRAGSVMYNQNPPIFTFTLQGMKLVRPAITSRLILGDVKIFSWRRSPGAKEYHAKLFYRNLDEKDYRLVREEKLSFLYWRTQRLEAGQYKLEVQAHAPKRASSDVAVFEFVIKPTEAEILQALGMPLQPL